MIAGLILAGGSGRRLGGVRKGDLRLANRSLLDRTVVRLAPQVDAILLSLPSGHAAMVQDGIAMLPDSPDGITGPAAGLLAGASWTRARASGGLMVSVSVDTPFFPADFVERALPLLDGDTGCVVAGYGGRDYPTNALWDVARLFDVLKGESPGPRGPRLRDLATRTGVTVCPYDDHPFNPFAGVNTLRDLLALSRGPGLRDATM